MPGRSSSRAVVRSVSSGAFLVAAGAAFVALATGRLEPLHLAAPATVEDQSQTSDGNELALGREASGFVVERLSAKDGFRSFRAKGARLVRAEPGEVPGGGFRIEDASVETWARDRDEVASVVRAPRGHVLGLSGKGPLRGTLEGGVSIHAGPAAFETEELTVELPTSNDADASGLQTLERIARERPEPLVHAAQPVRGSLVRAPARVSSREPFPVALAILAEGGLRASADMGRVELVGPVHVREARGLVHLEAHRRVVAWLATAPRRLFAHLDGTGAALGGIAPLVPELAGGRVLARLEAEGSVELTLDEDDVSLRAEGDRVVLDFLHGGIVATGTEAAPAKIVERTRRIGVRAPLVRARDLGRPGIEVRASGGAWASAARTVAATQHVRASDAGPASRDPRALEVQGEDLRATLLRTKGPHGRPELALRSIEARGSEKHPGRLASERAQGSFDELDLAVGPRPALDPLDEPVGSADDVALALRSSRGVELVSAESHLRARSVTLVRRAGEPDRGRLEGDASFVLGPDVIAIASDAGAQVSSASIARIASGIDVSKPVRARGAVLAFEAGKDELRRAHLEGPPARVEATSVRGEPMLVEGKLVDLDLIEGRFEGTGGVRVRLVPPETSHVVTEALTIEAEHVRALFDPDRGAWRALDRNARGVPEGLRSFEAEGSPARLAGSRGAKLAAESVRYDGSAKDLIATSTKDRVRVESERGFALARTVAAVESRGASPPTWTLDFTDDVHVEGESAKGTRATLDADRVRGDLVLVERAGKKQPELGTGRWEAIALPERKPVTFATVAREKEAPVVARARRVTVVPEGLDARRLVLVGAPGERPTVDRGDDHVEADRLELVQREGLEKSASFVLDGRAKVNVRAGELPFVVEATRITGEVDAEAARAKGKGLAKRVERAGDDPVFTRRLDEALGLVRSFEARGGVHATYKGQELSAEDLVYEGKSREATLRGSPVKVKDVAGRTFETREALLRLDPAR